MPEEIFCDPRCGFGCTRAAHDRAEREAAALAATMGDGWLTRIWDNCGWHYEVVKGVATVSPRVHGNQIRGQWVVEGFIATLDTTPQIRADASDPCDALGFAVQDARTVQERIGECLAAIAA